MRRVTLLTDFGTRDGFVGAMKGVMASIFPGIVVDDVSHDVPRGDPGAASLALARYWSRYPGGTVHVVVVDPGVGTERRAIAVEADRRLIVAPDNGAASRVLDAASSWRAVSIENPELVQPDASATFHGRDVFAPAAAYLARGVHVLRLGPRARELVRLPAPDVTREPAAVLGEVIGLDRFGNLITNVPGEELGAAAAVEVHGTRIPVGRTYGAVEPLEPVALVNSDGRVEVAVRDSSAAERLGAGIGTRVRVVLEAGGKEE